jgi:lysophospholipase L1-like esterase
VKTVLCFGDSNTWGCMPLTGPEPPRRYGPSRRWPGVLRRELGDGHWVVEEGLNGRTTVWDDALEPHRNGRDLLLPSLLTHQPVDLVIVMLGTNDLKRRFGLGARDIAAGAHVSFSDTDGIHLDASAHETLGVVLAREVHDLLASG